MGIGEAFRDGGWGMYPTTVFGIILLGAAVRYAAKPESRLVPLLVSLNVLTLLSGLLGFAMGIITTMKYVAHAAPDEHWVALVGLGESMENLSLALVLMVIGAVCAVVGAWRLARAAAPAVSARA